MFDFDIDHDLISPAASYSPSLASTRTTSATRWPTTAPGCPDREAPADES